MGNVSDLKAIGNAPTTIPFPDASKKLLLGNLWSVVEDVITSKEKDQYRNQGAFASKLGKIVVSTNSSNDSKVLAYPRYGEKVKGGRGWDTFARICFGWQNLIMTQGKEHARMSRILGPLFRETVVRDRYFTELQSVTESTLMDWSKEKDGLPLLAAALEHSCRSVTTCFLGKEAAKSSEIIEAVQNLLVVFWENTRLRPMAVIKHLSRQIFGSCCYDWDGYWHSQAVLEEAIESARLLATKDNFIGRLAENFTNQELIDNMKMLYFAGTETTGSLITTIVANLAANPEEQAKLREELHREGVLSAKDLSYEKIHHLHRLHAVLYESLRLAPPLPAQVREVYTDDGKYTYFIDHFHRLRDARLAGPEPDKFNSERFFDNDHLKAEVMKTFGGGLTPCLGKHFALTETLLFVAALVLHGPIELVSGNATEVILEAGAHLSPNLKIRLPYKFE